VSIALPDVSESRRPASPDVAAPITADGKFLRAGSERFLVKGVTYGTFAPAGNGYQFPGAARVAQDFALMRQYGINAVRLYTPPSRDLLDEAARHGLRVMVGLPWSQHVAFLDDRTLTRSIRRDTIEQVRMLGDHPALLMFALGNEIPPGVVRWHGRLRIERFLRHLYNEAKAVAPDRLFTYVNFPPTEFLDLSFFDVCAFNVYLHREPELRAWVHQVALAARPLEGRRVERVVPVGDVRDRDDVERPAAPDDEAARLPLRIRLAERGDPGEELGGVRGRGRHLLILSQLTGSK